MGKSQRTKGAVGEREVAQIFSEQLQRDYKRNIGQARDGGNDLDIGPLVVEVKRRKSLKTLMGWFLQAVRAASDRGWVDNEGKHVAVVVMREDNGPWLALLNLHDFIQLTKTELLRREALKRLQPGLSTEAIGNAP